MTSGALHRRITNDLASEIASGAWPPGHRVPFEHELMARYGCARATVNKAVHALAVQGLVERRRKAGTFVAPPHVASAVLSIPDIKAEIEARGEVYAWRRISWHIRRTLSEPDAAELKPAGALLAIKGLHLAAGRPFGFEERLVNLAEVPRAGDEDFTRVSPGAWLLTHVAWSEARHEIAAANPDVETAEALGVTRGHACLVLKRWTWRQEAGITFARLTFPAEAFELTARFAPGFADPRPVRARTPACRDDSREGRL